MWLVIECMVAGFIWLVTIRHAQHTCRLMDVYGSKGGLQRRRIPEPGYFLFLAVFVFIGATTDLDTLGSAAWAAAFYHCFLWFFFKGVCRG